MTGSRLDVRVLDVFDDDLLARWHAVYAGAREDAVGVEEAQVFDLPETTVQWREPTSDRARTALVGFVDDEVVAAGVVSLPLLDNLSAGYVEVAVAPAHQRRGHGSTMLAACEERATRAGRTILDSEGWWRYEHGTSGLDAGGAACVRFAERHGYRLGLSDVQRWLDVPVDDALLDRLAASAAPHHEAYELRSWVGPVADDLAPSWAELDGSLMTEAPVGDIEREAMAADVARMREEEASIAKQDRWTYHSVALADGVVVAYTLIVQGNRSRTAYQWGTLVHRDHRGHRLGLALKVANQRLLQRERPDATRVATWNAEVNDHMIAVNDALGYRPVSRMGEFQKRV
ncbi:GNAT family N-acetyltransferase [Nocardioides sp. C4-1]|uniref:GNAT family N-acetyltransferase n=1 Tax=Nocardioides sp. C4-1 TaxID=3151851 RepID=UPI0032670AD9